LKLTAGQVSWLDQLSRTFSLPALDDWQRAVLGRALRFVGYPYVWAGTSETTQKLWSATAPGGLVTAPGGFDCSGFVWRVYKTEAFAGAPLLGDILRGRTTYAMSAEVKKPARITSALLREPWDPLDTGRSRSHGHLRRERLVRALVERRCHPAAVAGLVHDDLRVGAATTAGGRDHGVEGPLAPRCSFGRSWVPAHPRLDSGTLQAHFRHSQVT
jgi:hypothetical protein